MATLISSTTTVCCRSRPWTSRTCPWAGAELDLRDHQVAQLLCATPRPSVMTITAGANDFLRGDMNVPAIASRVAEAVNILLYNRLSVRSPFPDRAAGPRLLAYGPRLTNVTILVFNYYNIRIRSRRSRRDSIWRFAASIPCCRGCSSHPPGRLQVEKVDLDTPSLGRQGLVVIERRLEFEGRSISTCIRPTLGTRSSRSSSRRSG